MKRNLRKIKRRLCIGRHQLFPLRAENDNAPNNVWQEVRVDEKHYTELYSDQEGQDDASEKSYLLNLKVSNVNGDKIRKVSFHVSSIY